MPLIPFSPVEVTVTERRRMEVPLLVLVWLGILGFCVAEQSFFYAMAGTFAVSINLAAARRARELYAHRFVVHAALASATLILLLELLAGNALLLTALGHYLILLQILKLFERKTNRDYLQMIAMSLLLLVAGALITDSLLFAVLLVVHLALLSYVVMVFTLKRSLDSAAAATLQTEHVPLEPQKVAWNVARDWPRRALLRRLAMAMGFILIAGIVVFLAAPRVGGGTGGPLQRARVESVSGFDTEVTLGDETDMFLSNRVVMHVSLQDTHDESRAPAQLYLRGATYDRYSRSRWSGVVEHAAPTGPAFSATAESLPPGPMVIQQVIMDSRLLPRVFAIAPTVHARSSAGVVRLAADGQPSLAALQRVGRQVRYTVYSWPLPLDSTQRRYLQARRNVNPQDDPPPPDASEAVKRLARQWCDDLLLARRDDPEDAGRYDLAIAQRLAARLRERCDYSLDLDAYEGDSDGIDEFLFKVKRGHCEYFASAHVIMCRLLGVRARLAAGFLTDEGSPVEGGFVVRGRHAHAWSEVYTPRTDWTIVDATPAASAAAEATLASRVKDFWEYLQFLWYRKIVGYDYDAQSRLISWARSWVRRAGEIARSTGAALRESFNNLLVHGYVDVALLRLSIVAGLLGALIEALFVARVIRRRRRTRRETIARYGVGPKQLAFFRRAMALLELRGLRRRPEQTYRQFATDLSREHPPTGEIFADLVDLYYRMRWANVRIAPDELAQAARSIERLASSSPPASASTATADQAAGV